MRNAKAVLVESLFDAPAPGQFKYWTAADMSGDHGLSFWCPCGCDSVLGVSFAPGRWQWNGNRECPTVTPSILHLDGCRWHGYLTDGEFREC